MLGRGELMQRKPTQWDYILKTIKYDCGNMELYVLLSFS